MDIFTFSQREGEQNNDLYIANGRDVALGDPKRESIYSLSSDIQENGHKVFVSEEVDVWSLLPPFNDSISFTLFFLLFAAEAT